MFNDIKVGDSVFKVAVCRPSYWGRKVFRFGVKLEVTKVLKTHFFCGGEKFTKKTGTRCGAEYQVNRTGTDDTEDYLRFRKRMTTANEIKRNCGNIREVNLYALDQGELDNVLATLENAMTKCEGGRND